MSWNLSAALRTRSAQVPFYDADAWNVSFIASAFIWLAERFGPLAAALSMATFFILVTIIVLVVYLLSRSATRRLASLELANRKRAMASIGG